MYKDEKEEIISCLLLTWSRVKETYIVASENNITSVRYLTDQEKLIDSRVSVYISGCSCAATYSSYLVTKFKKSDAARGYLSGA